VKLASHCTVTLVARIDRGLPEIVHHAIQRPAQNCQRFWPTSRRAEAQPRRHPCAHKSFMWSHEARFVADTMSNGRISVCYDLQINDD